MLGQLYICLQFFFLDNQSSTITFTSPITSSQYGDDIDSKYDEFSMDSGRHINFKKCTSKKTNSASNVSTYLIN